MGRQISIIGDIGSFSYLDRTGQKVDVDGIQVADVIAQVEALPAGTKALDVLMSTPGGAIDTGKAIFTYLNGLSSRIDITMRQVGDVASIGTYIWLAGKKRLAKKGINPRTNKPYGFNVHNPYTPHASGDASKMAQVTTSLQIEENEMAGFYQERTGLAAEAVLPIMKADSWFDADQAVALKFATGIDENLQLAAYHIPMDAKEKSNLVQDFLNFLTGKTKPVAADPGAPPAPAPPGGDLSGKAVLIDGKPAPDGIYTVAGGVVTLIAPLMAAPPAQPAAAPAAATPPVSFESMLEQNKDKFSEAVAATVQSALDKQKTDFEAQIVALKKQIKTTHVPEGFKPEGRADDAKEWDRSLKANEHAAMKKDDPEKYKRLFFAKYNRIPDL